MISRKFILDQQPTRKSYNIEYIMSQQLILEEYHFELIDIIVLLKLCSRISS